MTINIDIGSRVITSGGYVGTIYKIKDDCLYVDIGTKKVKVKKENTIILFTSYKDKRKLTSKRKNR